MNKSILFFLMIFTVFAVNAQKNSFQKEQKKYTNEAVETMRNFRKTSPLVLDDKRLPLLKQFEVYSDNLPNTTFREYLTSADSTASRLEHTTPILYCYRESFEKILDEVKSTKVKKGTTLVWMVYNMGFVVKTPTGCFGIDIDHRYAEKLEPYLDFLCITHNHGDHYNTGLMEAMLNHGKPVISNFYEKGGQYFSKTATSYKIGNFTISTDISDHLRSPDLQDFVTMFRIDCGEDSGNFTMLHCGDSGFLPERFLNVQGPVNLLILRWGAPRENEILGTGEGQVQPDYAVLSHLIELRHKPYPHGQASITKTLEHLPGVECENTIIPFWGEKLIWKKSKLK